MKSVFFAVLLVATMVGGAQAGVVIKGSDTVLPFSQKAAEIYLKTNPKASITVIGGGSGVGIAALIDGTCDIAQTSRPMKIKEKKQAKTKGSEAVETVVARDALTVIVHPSNPVKELNFPQLAGIFTGAITNWKEVGGPDLAIVVYSRESSSGTYAFFREHVLDNSEFAASALLAPATGAIVQSISQTPGAIGYIGMAYMTPDVLALKVAKDAESPFIEATTATAMSGAYPIARELFYYTRGEATGETKAFIDFVLSPAGQVVVSDLGYVPVATPAAGE